MKKILINRKTILIILLTTLLLDAQQSTQNGSIPAAFDSIYIEKLEMRDAPIGDVLRLIAAQNGTNIIVDPNVDQRVSIFLQNASLGDILNYLRREYHFTFHFEGNIIKVGHQSTGGNETFIKLGRNHQKIDIVSTLLPFGVLLDSLTNHTRDNFIYNGRFSEEKRSVRLLDLPYPDGLINYFRSTGLNVQSKGNLYFLSDIRKSGSGDRPVDFDHLLEVNEKGNLTIQLHDVPIAEVIQNAAKLLNKNVIIYEPPPGNISLHAEDIGFEELINIALKGSGFAFRRMEDVLVIGNQKIRGIQSTKVIKLEHIKVEGVNEKIPEYLKRDAEITEILEQNAISIVAYPSTINDLEKYLKEIDIEIPQVLIEAIVVDFDISNQKDMGLRGGLSDASVRDTLGIYRMIPGVDILFKGKIKENILNHVMGSFGNVLKITRLPDNFFLQLKALESVGKANVKSKPHIATLNGHEAELKIGVTQYYKLKTNNYYGGAYPHSTENASNQNGSPYYPSETERFEKVDATVSLKLTPWISGNNQVTVEIHPDFQTPVNDLNPEVPPTIQYRSLNSTVRLKDGETIILGGLIQEIEKEEKNQVPFFGDIPLLGVLFRSTTKIKQKKEMVIYVTPHLYKESKTGFDAYTNILFPD